MEPKTENDEVAPAAAKRKPPSEGTTPKAAKPKTKSKTGANAVAMAGKLKQRYGSAVVSASELVKTIKGNPDWRWAYNDTMLDGIEAAEKKLENSVREDALASMFISQEMAEIKKEFKDVSDYEEACRKFEVHVKPLVEALEHEAGTLVRMHRARPSKK